MGTLPVLIDSSSRLDAVVAQNDSVPVYLLDAKHPEYEARADAWTDLALLYEGGAALKARADRLLKKRPREDSEVYSARLDRFTYQNILGTALGWYGAAMFDQLPEVLFNDGKPNDQYTAFLGNCDGVGTDYINFFKKIFQTLLTYGAAWVLTDKRALQEDEQPPATLEEEKQRGLLDPHLACYTPLSVINWQLDDLGAIVWAVVKVETHRQEFLKKPEVVTTYYYYNTTEFRVYEDRRRRDETVGSSANDRSRFAKLIRQGSHVLSHVNRPPLRRLSLSEGLWLANRAYLLLIDHLNQDNTLGWSLFMSNLAIPVIIGDVDVSNLTYSEVGHLRFPAGTEYGWSEPEGKSFIHSAKRVESLREECFRSMSLQQQGRSMRATPAMQSGRSKILEMAPANQILAGMGEDVRQHMQDVLKDVVAAKRDSGVEPDVRGFVFQEDMTTEEVFAVTSLIQLRIPSETFERSVYKRVVKAASRGVNKSELAKMYMEIEAGPTLEERETEDLKKSIELAKAGMRSAMSKKSSANMPPGRGGAGPSPRNPEQKGKEK